MGLNKALASLGTEMSEIRLWKGIRLSIGGSVGGT